jgi:multidrug efflux pump subunit AcrA (membrane-fusion protein)
MKLYLKAGFFSLGLLVACTGSDQNKNRFTGLVEGTKIQIPALTGGKIEILSFDTGDKIEEGQFLALVDTMALTLQLDQLSGSMAEIEAQKKLANTNLKKTQNDLEYIQEKYNRFLKLWKTKSVNQQTVDDIENRFNAAQMASQAARQQFETISAKKKQIVAGIMLGKIL